MDSGGLSPTRIYLPQFIVEKDLAEVKEAGITQEICTCIGCRDDASACTNQLSRYPRYCCSGKCMINTKERGTYRDD